MIVIGVISVLAVIGCVAGKPWSNIGVVKKFDRTKDTVKYRDCHHLHQAGYTYPGTFDIWVHGKYPIKVFCENSQNASSTVIQRRENGKFSFQQPYTSYVDGFGDMPPARGDFWLGLNRINYLTTTAGNNILTVVIEDWDNRVSHATFKSFHVNGSSDQYRMYIGPKVAGDLADDLSYNSGMPFATQDRPDKSNCAKNQQAGWWYAFCTKALPNGNYFVGGSYSPVGNWYTGIYWYDWRGLNYSAKFLSMSVSH